MKSKPQFSELCKRLSPTYIGTPEALPPAFGSTVILVKSGLKSRTKEKAFLKRVSEIYPRQTAQAWEFRACESGSGSLEDACTLIPDRGGRPSSPPCQPRRSLPFRSPILRLQRSLPSDRADSSTLPGRSRTVRTAGRCHAPRAGKLPSGVSRPGTLFSSYQSNLL